MNNYEFCAEIARRVAGSRDHFTVLDYGCGGGEIVRLLAQQGVNAFGCDVFYGGGDIVHGRTSERIRAMPTGAVPFPDATFDLVISNQVLEHVNDLGAVLDEIERVLKPGGIVLSLFPSREVWREGHSGIPFLHRLPDSRIRILYATAIRRLGFGFHKGNKSAREWATDFCRWIDAWCHYRPYTEIAREFEARFGALHHIETEWIVARAPRLRFLPESFLRLTALKWGHLIFYCQKPLRQVDRQSLKAA